MSPHDLTRRAFSGAALLGLSTPVLAGCGEDASGNGAEGPASPTPPPSEESPQAGTGNAEGGPDGASLVATSEVPVGGGIVLADAKLVVTQPVDGEFKCFTAVCTHQGCLVGKVERDQIVCPCHGSRFSVVDGSVVQGPATSSLAEVPVTVQGDQVLEG